MSKSLAAMPIAALRQRPFVGCGSRVSKRRRRASGDGAPPEPNPALKRVIGCERDESGKPVSDGWGALSLPESRRCRQSRGQCWRSEFLRHLGQSRATEHQRHADAQRANPLLCCWGPCTPRNCARQGGHGWTRPTAFGASSNVPRNGSSVMDMIVASNGLCRRARQSFLLFTTARPSME